jgi:hypothetical protein
MVSGRVYEQQVHQHQVVERNQHLQSAVRCGIVYGNARQIEGAPERNQFGLHVCYNG